MASATEGGAQGDEPNNYFLAEYGTAFRLKFGGSVSVIEGWPKLTFDDEVEEFWSGAALALDGARVEAIVADIHLRYLKAVLVFVPDSWHDGHARVHRPLVVPCEYDAGAVQPGPFRDPIQQVAPAQGRKGTLAAWLQPRRTLLKFLSFDN